MSIYLATFGKLRYLGLAEVPDAAASEARWILIRTVRGLEMGLLGGPLSQEQEAKYRASCIEDGSGEHTRGPEPMLQEVEYVGNADADRIEEYYRCRGDEDSVLLRSREILVSHGLQMKLVDVEFLLDRKKLFFYFTSEQRVDFRGYVRDLAREFRTRIEMRQIGVRDEARVVSGIGPCGRPCCCSYWLHRFTPICIRMVKEQNLALNPTKISGICGRLMCCMAYEHPLYSALWKSLPSPGAKIRTENGTYVLDSVDLASESVRVRFPNGHLVPVSIAEFPDFREAVLQGQDWGGEAAASAAAPRFAPGAQRRGAGARKDTGAGRTETRPAASRPMDRRGKPEKVSLDEHLASMAGREPGRPVSDLPESAEREAPGNGEQSAAPKKRRRRKSGGAARGDAPAQGPSASPAVEGAEEKGTRPNRPPRRRPERQDRPGTGNEPPPGGDEPRGEESGRPRRRRRPDRRPRERQDGGGDTGKGEA